MIVDGLAQLPAEYTCLLCSSTKPIVEMVVVRLRRQKKIMLRPRCKDCHNKNERGHRREYKRKYLRAWRKHHPEENESYWREYQSSNRGRINARAYMRFLNNHAALLIQGRLRRALGMKVSLQEAKRMERKYGPNYPTRFGLTESGLRECERIRSRNRRDAKRLLPAEIRLMVYDDGGAFVLKRSRQAFPYKRASENLRRWHAQKRAA